MTQFDNPYNTEDERPNSPGETAQYWAGLVGMGFAFVGVKLTPSETEALATVINAINRAYPQLQELALAMEQNKNDKGTI